MRDDPKRPWKAIAGAVSAGLTSLLTFANDLPLGVVVASTVGVAMLATYLVPNPKI